MRVFEDVRASVRPFLSGERQSTFAWTFPARSSNDALVLACVRFVNHEIVIHKNEKARTEKAAGHIRVLALCLTWRQ